MFLVRAVQAMDLPCGRLGRARREPLVPTRLDAIDWKILDELQRNGRITNVELARVVGISAPPCLRRMRALEHAAFIQGYRALPDETLLGYEVTVSAIGHPATTVSSPASSLSSSSAR